MTGFAENLFPENQSLRSWLRVWILEQGPTSLLSLHAKLGLAIGQQRHR